MTPAHSLDGVRRDLAYAFKNRYPDKNADKVRIVGLLFAPPGEQITKKEILPRLDDFHHRSGNNIDFFCAGYGAHWPEGWIKDEEVVATLTKPPYGHKVKWLYSSMLYDEFRDEIKKATNEKWKYSGNVDLILVNAHPDTEEYARLDFSRSIILYLSKLKNDKLIESIGELFELIFTFAEHQQGSDPTWGYSNAMGFREGKSWFINLILALLPAKAGRLWKAAKHYAVLDLA
jgi:hypothetical protein